MAEHMSNDDMSFHDLVEALGTHVKRPRTADSESSTQTGKGRSKHRSNFSDSSRKSEQDASLVQMLAKLCLRQEDMINAMCLDRSFLLFLQAGKGSILPTMLTASKEWHTQKQQAGVTCPLRQVLFLKVVEELVQRIGRLNVEDSADALCTNLRSKQILNAQNEWNYMSWDQQAKCLRPTKQEPLSFVRVREILTLLTRLGANTELIHKFAPMKPMNQEGIQEDSQLVIPWRLDISLRSPESHQMFGALMALCGNGMGQMVLLRIRTTSLQRSPLAQAIARQVRT